MDEWDLMAPWPEAPTHERRQAENAVLEAAKSLEKYWGDEHKFRRECRGGCYVCAVIYAVQHLRSLTQPEAKRPEPGWYWARDHRDGWVVVRYDGLFWLKFDDHETVFGEGDFVEIGPRVQPPKDF